MGLKSDRSSVIKHLREHVGSATLVWEQLWCMLFELRGVRTGEPFSTSLGSSMFAVADGFVNVTQEWGQMKAHEFGSVVTKW